MTGFIAVEHDTKDPVTRFRAFAKQAAAKGFLKPKERHHMLNLYRDGLDGCTYFEN